MDPKELTDEELEKQVTADVILEASWKPADPTAKETANKDLEPKKVEDPKKPEGEPKGDDPKDPEPKKEWDPEWKKDVPSSIKTLLAKKNEEKKLKEDALETVKKQSDKIAELEKTIADLKNPNDDDTMSEEERNEKLQEAISKKAIAEEKKEEALEKSNAIDTTDETKRTAEIWDFFAKNPELLANKSEIMDLANAYPALPMDQVNKLRVANTDPMKLLTEQDVNKIKWWFNLAGKFDKTRVAGKKAQDMSDDELEASLNDTFSGWGNILWGG